MRKNIQINVNTETNFISKDRKELGISTENLQGKIIFKPEPFVNGACRLYIERTRLYFDGKGRRLLHAGYQEQSTKNTTALIFVSKLPKQKMKMEYPFSLLKKSI